MDAHPAKAVRAVRTPIVIGPEHVVSIIVGPLFVIPAERVAPAFCGALLKKIREK
jgi:hypothetical protein